MDSRGNSSRNGVVTSWEASIGSRVTIASIANWNSSLSLNSGQTRENSDLEDNDDIIIL